MCKILLLTQMAKGTTDQQTRSKEAAMEEDHEADEEYLDEEFADEEFSGMESDAALSARKEAFYKEVDKRLLLCQKYRRMLISFLIGCSMRSTTSCCPSRMHLMKCGWHC